MTPKRSRKCRVCGSPIVQPDTGRPRKFCGDNCRQRAHRTRPTRTAAVLSSASNEWYTPARYIDAARDVMGGIDLDPASCIAANQTVQAARFYTVDDDGLAHRWKGRVWLNPPYGRLAGRFVAKLDEHYRAGDVTAAVVLVNSSASETAWFAPLWCHPLCFVRGRIDFHTGGREKRSTATHGSVIAYLGADRARFTQRFADFGNVVECVATP